MASFLARQGITECKDNAIHWNCGRFRRPLRKAPVFEEICAPGTSIDQWTETPAVE